MIRDNSGKILRVGDRCDEKCTFHRMDGHGFHCLKTGKIIHIFSKSWGASISALMDQCPLEEKD